jgi:polyvinyl alcohol dehydrogenase (cytochrome)
MDEGGAMRLGGLMVLAMSVWGQDGAAVYRQACMSCHPAGRFSGRPAAAVVRALETGVMWQHGMTLTQAQRVAVAEFVTGNRVLPEVAMPRCAAGAEFHAGGATWSGWGVDARNTRFQPEPGLTAAQAPALRLKWAFGFPGDNLAFGQAAVTGGRVFAGSQGGRVYSLDAESGCVHWVFEAAAGVRTAIEIAADVAYFGDLAANVYAVDTSTGKLKWKMRADAHPYALITGAVKLAAGRVIVPVSSFEEGPAADGKYQCCTFRGSIVALDQGTGREVWRSWMIGQPAVRRGQNKIGTPRFGPSGVAVWASPTIDERRGAVYVATGNNYTAPVTPLSDAIVALDLRTGRRLWQRQMMPGEAWNAGCNRPGKANCPDDEGPDFDFGSSPVLVELGAGRSVLVGAQKSGLVYGLDPAARGRLLWTTRVGVGGKLGGVQWGVATDGQRVYTAISDLEWLVMGTRVAGGFVFDPKKGGGLQALSPATGARLWSAPAASVCEGRAACSPAQSAAVTALPGVVFSGSVDGHLRAYASEDGRVLWDYDTARDFTTVNGVAARGGSIDSAGAVVAGGMVFATSGYSLFGGMAGNVLLAFGLDKQ